MAAIELRRLFPGITDNAQARTCAWTIYQLASVPDQAAAVRHGVSPPSGQSTYVWSVSHPRFRVNWGSASD